MAARGVVLDNAVIATRWGEADLVSPSLIKRPRRPPLLVAQVSHTALIGAATHILQVLETLARSLLAQRRFF
jgi:hypothetical protein